MHSHIPVFYLINLSRKAFGIRIPCELPHFWIVACIKQKVKLKPEAMEELFNEFNLSVYSMSSTGTNKKFRTIAADGFQLYSLNQISVPDPV